MDDRQIFWCCLGWFGLTQAVNWGLDVLRVDVWPGNAVALVGSVLVVLVSLFALARPERLSGPRERDATFWAAVAGAVLGTLALFF